MYAYIIKQAIRRNVIIYAYTPKGKFVGMGSGVAIGKHYILTVSHILGQFTQPLNITVLYGNGKYKAEIIKEDGGKDGLALLFCKDIKERKVRIAYPHMCQEVLIYGNVPTILDIPIIGNILRVTDTSILDDISLTVYDQWIMINSMVQGGFSGGGIYTNEGLVGIIWGHLNIGRIPIALGITPQHILAFTQGLWEEV